MMCDANQDVIGWGRDANDSRAQFKGVIDGAQMAGKMKAGFMGSYAFTAVKI